ncbi:hypothetical protein BU16DRAFT_282695 [Lophium mytilinum]|uniref:Uncharacterized protein n=1 Tax=Lophium mytilinum TaxID=390894 RepID=A0A6A6R5T6_9PEZI|nr:hypothetical protein BU16DRAFT_282695 [Lophium mytilinum]
MHMLIKSPDSQNSFVSIPRQMPSRPLQTSNVGHMGSHPAYNQMYANTFTQQSPQQEPWSAVGHLRNETVSNSDSLLFDPESSISLGSNNWPTATDFSSFLVSPHSPNDFPLNTGYGYDNQMASVEMEVSISGPHPDPYTYRQSPIVPNAYAQSSLGRAPSDAASTGVMPRLSPYPDPTSPYSAQGGPSPGSEGVFSSYQPSDPGANMDSFQPPEHLKNSPSPAPTSSNASISTSQYAAPITYGPEPARSRTSRQQANRPGGRQLGSHLRPEVAKDAHDMRKVVACWHCVLQRDKCGPGDICERCLKRSMRPNTDCGLGCSRVRLWELACYFLPSITTSMHEDSQLTNFVALHIHQWSNTEVSLRMSCGEGLPEFPVKVYEFTPKTNELLRQFQYITDQYTGDQSRVEKRSPPLGMVQINHKDEQKYDRYIDLIVDKHLPVFAHNHLGYEQHDFQLKLFLMMTQLKPKAEDEKKLLREVFKLVVVTYIMARTFTIAEDTREESLRKLRSYQPGIYAEEFCSPRMTNRQLKYFFCRLQQTIMQNVLNKLQQIFKSSKGCDKWTAAFCAILGLAMAHEDNQQTIHLVMETRAASLEILPQEAKAQSELACKDIDEQFAFVMAIFRWKYNRSYNPLKDSEIDWMSKLKDAGAIKFVRDVAGLVTENSDYLYRRQHVSIAQENQGQYGSRLTAQFLLSFWLPS